MCKHADCRQLVLQVLFHADRDQTRYNEFLSDFVRAWTDRAPARAPPTGIALLNGLSYEAPPFWAQQSSPQAFVTPGPNGMNARAMAIVALHAAGQRIETDEDRDAACFAQNQLRCAASPARTTGCRALCGACVWSNTCDFCPNKPWQRRLCTGGVLECSMRKSST